MKTPVLERLNQALIAIFSVFWVLVVLISYLGFHPYYFTSLITVPNANLLLGNLIIIGIAWAWWVYGGQAGRTRKVNGLQIYGLFLLLQIVSLVLYNNSYNILESPLSVLSFMGTNLLVHGSLFLLFSFAYSVGQPIVDRFSVFYSKGSVKILSVALGTSLIALAVFFLGIFHLHTTIITGGLMLGFLGLRHRQVLLFWEESLMKRRPCKFNNRWLQIPVFLLLNSLAVNGLSSIKPFPTGFDGAALYMNMTHLIASYQGLIEGGQAYNWQLILSLGEVLFGKEVFSIAIAHFSFVLVLLVSFRLSRILMGRAWSWAAVCLLALNPSFNFHYVFDEKVDLGFTFISLSAFLLMIEYWTAEKRKPATQEGNVKMPFNLAPEHAMFILAGWLLGFAFGIKYTGFFGIATAFSLLGYRYGNYWLSAAILIGFTAAMFVVGAGEFAYFPFEGTSPHVPGFIGVVVAAGLLVPAFLQRVQAKSFIQSILLVGGMSVLCFMPWAVRNVAANGQLSVKAVLTSPKPTPGLNPVNLSEPKGKTGARDTGEEPTNSGGGATGLKLPEVEREDFFNPEENEKIKGSSPFWGGTEQAESRKMPAEEKQGPTPAKQQEKPQQERPQKAAGNPAPPQENTAGQIKELPSSAEQVKREELRRYLGYESGLPLYASLPYDLTMNNNIQKSQYLDISFLFLILFPLVLFIRRPQGIVHNIVLCVLSLFLLLLGVWTVEKNEGYSLLSEQMALNAAPSSGAFAQGLWTSVNKSLLAMTVPLEGLFTRISAFGFTSVFIGVLVLGGIWGWLMKNRFSENNRKAKYLLIFATSFGGLWLIMGSGIAWYGFPMLAVLLVFLFYAAKNQGFNLRSVRSGAALAALFVYALFGYSLVFINSVQAYNSAGLVYEEPVLRSFGAGMNRTETLSAFKPYLGEAISYINRDTADKVYRVGTFFNYHIDYNDSRVLEDNQLGKFDNMMRVLDGDEEQFLNLLKESGFRFILFDLNTATLDRTPEKSLTEKTRRFMQMLFSSPNAHLIFTDNIVEGEPGETVPLGRHRIAGQAGFRGKTVYRGSYILFEIN